MLALQLAAGKDSSAEMLALLVSHDMPINLDGLNDEFTNKAYEYAQSWAFLVGQDSEECSKAVGLLLAPKTDSPAGYGYGRHAAVLAEVLNPAHRSALKIAQDGPRKAIYKHLLICAGVEVKITL